jgi:hypothetical protein
VIEHPAVVTVRPVHLGSDSEEVQIPVLLERDDPQLDEVTVKVAHGRRGGIWSPPVRRHRVRQSMPR